MYTSPLQVSLPRLTSISWCASSPLPALRSNSSNKKSPLVQVTFLSTWTACFVLATLSDTHISYWTCLLWDSNFFFSWEDEGSLKRKKIIKSPEFSQMHSFGLLPELPISSGLRDDVLWQEGRFLSPVHTNPRFLLLSRAWLKPVGCCVTRSQWPASWPTPVTTAGHNRIRRQQSLKQELKGKKQQPWPVAGTLEELESSPLQR